MSKSYNGYKRSKIFKSNLFWGVTVGILLTLTTIITLPLVSIAQVNKQKDALMNELSQDFNDINLFPNKLSEGKEIPYTDTNDFIEKTSIDLTNTTDRYTKSRSLKEEFLKTSESLNLNIISLIVPIILEVPKLLQTNSVLETIGILFQDFILPHIPYSDNTLETPSVSYNFIDPNGNFVEEEVNIFTTENMISQEQGYFQTLNPKASELNISLFGFDQSSLSIKDAPTKSKELKIDLHPKPLIEYISIKTNSFYLTNSMSDDGKVWWKHNKDESYIFSGANQLTLSNNDLLNFNQQYFDIEVVLGLSGIAFQFVNRFIKDPVLESLLLNKDPNELVIPLQFKQETSINFIYQLKLFERSNHFKNVLIGIGVLDGEYDYDYSNSFFALSDWISIKASNYNKSELLSIYNFIYEKTDWRSSWNQLFNKEELLSNEALLIDLDKTLPSNYSLSTKELFVDSIVNPSFEMFYEVTSNLNLLFDKTFEKVREQILNDIVNEINLKDIPYRY